MTDPTMKYLLIPLLLLPLIAVADGYIRPPYEEFGFAIEDRHYQFRMPGPGRKEALRQVVAELKTLLLLAEWSLEVYEE